MWLPTTSFSVEDVKTTEKTTENYGKTEDLGKNHSFDESKS